MAPAAPKVSLLPLLPLMFGAPAAPQFPQLPLKFPDFALLPLIFQDTPPTPRGVDVWQLYTLSHKIKRNLALCHTPREGGHSLTAKLSVIR